MKNKIPCEIIRDLLPSYIDELTSEETNTMVKDHLLSCEGCRETAKRMGKAEEIITEEDEKEIDFLKKSKKKQKRNLFFVIALVAFAYIYITIFGFTITGEEVPYDFIDDCKIEVDGSEMTISGKLSNLDLNVQDVKIEESNGVVKVSVIRAWLLPFTRNDFEESLEVDENSSIIPYPIREVWVGNEIAWANGIQIEPEVARMYNQKTPYVGESYKVQRLLDNAIHCDSYDLLGDYTMELQTEKEPYGITIIADNMIATGDKGNFEDEVKKIATVMIGGIGNLEEVTFVYNVNGIESSITIDKTEADKIAGGVAKECFVSADKLQELMVELELLN